MIVFQIQSLRDSENASEVVKMLQR